jgi:hypothetical protein
MTMAVSVGVSRDVDLRLYLDASMNLDLDHHASSVAFVSRAMSITMNVDA